MQLKRVAPWLVVVAVYTMNRWFPPVYRAVPIPMWIALMCAVAVRGVWMWVAWGLEKRKP